MKAVFASILLAVGIAQAQSTASYTTITGSHIGDLTGTGAASGRLCFMPVDATEKPVGFRSGNTQVLPLEKCATVTAGVVQSGFNVVTPIAGVYYHVYMKPAAGNVILNDYGMTGITGSAWSMDTYDPSTAIVPLSSLTAGSVGTLPCTSGPTATITGTGPYLFNLNIPSVTPSIGTVTQTGLGSSATVTLSGSSACPVFNFGIPTAPAGTDTNAVHNNTTTPQAMAGLLFIPDSTSYVTGCSGLTTGGVCAKATITDAFGAHCGAKGDGITDDAAAIQSCIYYARTHSEHIDFPPGRYLFKTGLWLCGTEVSNTALCPGNVGIVLRGHNQFDTFLEPDLTVAGIAIDAGSGYNTGLENITVTDQGLSGDNTTLAVSFAAAGGGGGQVGDFLRHVIINTQSSAAAGFGVLYGAVDLSYNDDVQVIAKNSALVAGGNTGTMHGAVTSPYYTLDNSSGVVTASGSFTHFNLGQNSSYATYGGVPAIQITGVGELDCGVNVYATTDGAFPSASHGVIEMSGVEYVHCPGLRTEYHGGGSPVPAISAVWLNAGATLMGGDLGGMLTTSATGSILGGASGAAIQYITIEANDGGEGSLFNYAGSLAHSTLGIGLQAFGVTSMGTISGNVYDVTIRTAEAISSANMFTGMTSTNPPQFLTVCGNTPCISYGRTESAFVLTDQGICTLSSGTCGGAYPGFALTGGHYNGYPNCTVNYRAGTGTVGGVLACLVQNISGTWYVYITDTASGDTAQVYWEVF